ncbi:MAG: hypothetical protein IT342_25790 [Candidatus Melainabacteria bacterium]|nr:hypothetical protein [Candidatus Melainabacteria bacterium]
MQSPASFLHAYAILESEFDADSMLEQLASQKETAARAPFMAPAFLREQITRMQWRNKILNEIEVAETNRFKVGNGHNGQDMTGALPVFTKPANITRSRIEALDVLRKSPLECPKERYRGLPEKRSDIRECIDYASLSDLLEEIQFKQMGIASFDSRFSTNLPRIAKTATDSLFETFYGCLAVFKLFFSKASLGFTDYSN